MSGNMKCDLSSGSPQDSGFGGNYVNGSRGSHQAPSLDRIGSFRENMNGRVFSSGASISKGKASDLPPVTQCLALEPMALGDQKYRYGECCRVLGYSEDNSFGAAHPKPASASNVEDLKRFRASIQDGSYKARIRVKTFEDNSNKVGLYMQKRQIIQRSSGSNLLRPGAQSHRKSPDQMTLKMDDKGRSALSKRIRTPVADIMRPEGRGGAISRQNMVLGKDKDITKQESLTSGFMEEKIRKLPAGGETWDKKMKRKRSVSNVIARPVDGEAEAKRVMHGRVSIDSGLPSSDASPFRLASSNGVGSNIKPDSTLSSPISSVRPTAKNEMEKISLSRELGGMNKERILQKGSNKLNLRDENLLVSPSLSTKGKASRGQRAGPLIMDSPSPTFSRMAGTPEDWEQPSNLNKIHSLGGINNRKRVFSSELSPPVTQWVGQRQQKNSRVRRTNIISPTSNNDEALVSSEGSPAPDFGPTTSTGFNGSFPAWSIHNNPQPLKGKRDNTPSPARLSEGEETGAVENRLKDRKVGSDELEEKGINGYQHIGSPGFIPKKNKLLVKEEIGDGVRRQGRSGRGPSFSRGGMSPLREKLDSPAAANKPVRIMKPGSDKNGSKSGRPPLKKHLERKGFTRLGLLPNGNSPDCIAESDDDREDLIAAAQLASSANEINTFSSPLWKNVGPLFARADYAKQQLKSLEEHQDSPSQMLSSANTMKDVSEEEKHQSRNFGYQGEKVTLSYGVEPTTSDMYCRRETEEGPQGLTPLLQRVLSALIVPDELEEFERTNCGRSPFFSGGEAAYSMEEKLFANGDIPSQLDLWEGNRSFMHSEVGLLPARCHSNSKGSIAPEINHCDDSPSQVEYAQMSVDEKLLIELQSIGLHPEIVPDLAEGEDEVFEDTLQMQKQLCHVGEKKKLCLGRIQKAVEVEKDREERVLEQDAMERLVVTAHRKLLATRGNTAAKMGVNKVPRHVALSFVKRTLTRCEKLEETGKSCFTEPNLRDVLLASPPSSSYAETFRPVSLEDHNLQSDQNAPGSKPKGTSRGLIESNDSHPHHHHPVELRGKKKEISLDDVNNNNNNNKIGSLKPAPLGGAKGKRSERDRDKAAAAAGRGGERKAKPKPKQKSHNSTHPVYPSPSRPRPANAQDAAADLTNLPLTDLDSIEIAVAGNQDLDSWLNFEEDNIQDDDDDSIMGLQIPMDDLADLF